MYLFKGHRLCLPVIFSEIAKRCFMLQKFKKEVLTNVKVDDPPHFADQWLN